MTHNLNNIYFLLAELQKKSIFSFIPKLKKLRFYVRYSTFLYTFLTLHFLYFFISKTKKMLIFYSEENWKNTDFTRLFNFSYIFFIFNSTFQFFIYNSIDSNMHKTHTQKNEFFDFFYKFQKNTWHFYWPMLR